ncbi:MAG: alpha/beta hydrolase [Luminiphilus sp.]|nr:alpha/beta hydrolase [Luminiphilus sp.]
MYHGQPDKPMVIYAHGGGFVIGSLETHDRFCRALSVGSGCSLVSIDYRLAPEYTFPAAHDDCLDATEWVIENLENLAPNNGLFILAGDSAGGNIAIASTLALQHRHGIAGCLAIYPATQHYISDLPSHTEHAKSGLVPARNMRWFCNTYLDSMAPADPVLERIFPGRRTSLNHFPRTLIITAERDPIRDDGARFAVRLHRSSRKITYKHLDHASHGFVCSEGDSEHFQKAVSIASQWLAIPLTLRSPQEH